MQRFFRENQCFQHPGGLDAHQHAQHVTNLLQSYIKTLRYAWSAGGEIRTPESLRTLVCFIPIQGRGLRREKRSFPLFQDQRNNRSATPAVEKEYRVFRELIGFSNADAVSLEGFLQLREGFENDSIHPHPLCREYVRFQIVHENHV